ncbi:purine nucleoside transporter PunC [Shewanella intestini]|uniref:Bcr/CflA family efflux transporter n=1 Tax=Shewanella intestini TaxID=2017544 RepID=A0ABS5I0D9_9GAMM|nr:MULTISPECIES: purine nucleoside transporter PunC [Shewanella]MBR9727154.1 Bcr/CflA family multidrug efflux MFS transporter [Shewanella intestini]MRG35956.1 Bcr/CflA family multidrug efflux MFS transporter [Shewanella sp. XMDDZSB0408]
MCNSSKTTSIISQYGFFLYLTLLSMLGFVATDMYLPAFKTIESSLGATTSQVAMSLTTFLAGLAIGQLLYGKLVENWGKRQSLIFGIVLFIVASAIIALSESIEMMNIGRFFQAIGVCSTGVIWQALVIEKYDEKHAQKMLSSIMPLVALSPALAPLIGSFILSYWNWQSIFICLAIIGLLLVIMTQLYVAKDTSTTIAHCDEAMVPSSFKHMLSNPYYMGNVLMFAACSGAFFSYLTLWPAVMDQFGYDAKAIGLSFIPQTIMFIVGGYGGKLLINKLGSKKALLWKLGLFFITSVLISLITLVFNMTSIYPLLIVFAFMAAANGAIYPIVVNNALQTFSGDAAKAAGLQNFIQISIAFGASSIVASFAHAGAKAIGLGILISSLLVFVAFMISRVQSWHELGQYFTHPESARMGIGHEKE